MSAKIHLCFKRESLGPPYILLHVIPTLLHANIPTLLHGLHVGYVIFVSRNVFSGLYEFHTKSSTHQAQPHLKPELSNINSTHG